MAGHSLQSRADCEANFDLIRSWIVQCELHRACSQVPKFASEFYLPTRLIDINPGPTVPGPRLVNSVDLDEGADRRYVALSHCWGHPSKVPKTIRATLAQHQEQILRLSKTFEDAIEVTRQIGVRYLWIDSLCIIQEDTTEWEVECSKMSFTYARAYCVLSALDAEDGSVGLFIPRNSDSPLPYDWPKHWTSLLNGHLSSRGWAFQEHQLATRIIHFTQHRLLWECRACIGSEKSPSLLHRSFTGNRLGKAGATSSVWRLFDGASEKSSEIYTKNFKSTLVGRPQKENIYTCWLKAVELYSSRSLTFSDDKLPALSGLAAAISATLDEDMYLAGIWKYDFLRGLLWARPEAASACEQPRVISTPSWSWASYPGHVRFLGAVLNQTENEGVFGSPFPDLTATFDDEGHRRWWEITTSNPTESTCDGTPVVYPRGSKPWSPSLIMNYRATPLSLDPFGKVSGGTLEVFSIAQELNISITSNPERKWQVLDDGFERMRISLDYYYEDGVIIAATIVRLMAQDLDGCYGLVLIRDTNAFRRIGVFWLSMVWGELGEGPGYPGAFKGTNLTII